LVLAVGQIIESQCGAVRKALWEKKNAREVLSLLGAVLMLILLIYLHIDFHWLVLLLSVIVHLAHKVRKRIILEQFKCAAPCDSSGKNACLKAKGELDQNISVGCWEGVKEAAAFLG
jgi:hypothetical protein